MKYFIAMLPVFLTISCSNKTPETKAVLEPAKTSHLNCYSYINVQDTILLKTDLSGSSVTGTLVYKLAGKDKNMGTIQGFMKGSLVLVDYTFMSEGLNSVRQVVFKKTADGIVEGYGKVEDENGKIKFTNIDSLDYTTSFLLKEVECGN